MIENNSVFIVIDMQNDFITGTLAIPGAEELPAKIAAKVAEFKKEHETDGTVIFTLDTHYSNYLNTREGKYIPIKHCIHMTPGWCIVDELYDAMQESDVVEKSDFALDSWIYQMHDFNVNPTSIEICGVATDICVITNAVILRQFFPDIPIKVYADLCAGTSPEFHKAALNVMQSCQIEIV